MPVNILTIFISIFSFGTDPPAKHLDVFPACPAVELIEPKLLPAHVVPRPRLVLHVYPKIYILLGSEHLRAGGEAGRERERTEQTVKQSRHLGQKDGTPTRAGRRARGARGLGFGCPSLDSCGRGIRHSTCNSSQSWLPTANQTWVFLQSKSVGLGLVCFFFF